MPPQARTALSFSRDLEFVSSSELAKRMGCSRELWLRAVAKEILDNSLDACEEHGIAPVITVTADEHRLTIADNGPGITGEMVARLCNRAQRTSTKEAFAAPDRGSQGNAIQTIMCLPFGFGSDTACITIESRGVCHTISLRVNRLAQSVEIEHFEEANSDVVTGTAITIQWPEEIDWGAIKTLVAEHAWLNRHAEFVVDGDRWRGSVTIKKWTPGLPIPPAWYTPDRFAHRILLEIANDPTITVQQFLGTFRGLTNRSRRAEIATDLGLTGKPLSALLDTSGTKLDAAAASRLLYAMQSACRAPKHDVLGGVGKETVSDFVSNLDYNGRAEPQLFAYQTLDAEYGDIPIRWEIGFAHMPNAGERMLLVGHNFSPMIKPEHLTNLVLEHCNAEHFGSNQPIALFLHRITPWCHTLDFGKAQIALANGETRLVAEALRQRAKAWIKHRDRQMRGKTSRLPAERKTKRMTIKDAVTRYLPAAYRIASSNGRYPTSPRQLYYRLRPKVLKVTGKKTFGYNYFSTDLLPRFEQDHPEMTVGWRIFRKARGQLSEPHTGRTIPLGTAEVASYQARWTNGLDHLGLSFEMPEWTPSTCGPANRYGGVLVVEKDGIADLLLLAGVDERFDVGIAGNEGQSVEAELRLADALGIPVFVLHDFDRTGLTICENLRAGTWRHRYQNDVEVVEIGLRLEDVGGFEREPIDEDNLKSVGNDRLRECGATEDEIEFLAKERVELNALTTAQLVEMVEDALTEHGIEKIVPDADALTAAWRSAMAHVEITAAVAVANEKVERWQDETAPDALADQISAMLEEDPSLSWDDALRQICEQT